MSNGERTFRLLGTLKGHGVRFPWGKRRKDAAVMNILESLQEAYDAGIDRERTRPKLRLSRGQCRWSSIGSDNYYETECGEAFMLTENDNIKEAGFKYCTFCGKTIVPIHNKEEQNDDAS